MKCCTATTQTNTANMIDALIYNPQPENWLYEIRQKGHDSTCYVMVPHARVRFLFYYIRKSTTTTTIYGIYSQSLSVFGKVGKQS